ncbi:hypothetical protein ACHAXA_002548 [Cyclostephanos tholiformis]|uniref:Uncharacterized protein n=1 Tax=Cyclostephanos tholiformis TaxID=382380 RepID=A0ABD3R3Q3_9STRA
MQQATKFVPGGMSSSRNPHDSLGQRTMIQQHQHRRQQKREMGIGVPLAGAAGGGGTAALT